MRNIKAFTFIELIVTITIISLISFTWVFYFHDFIWKQEINIHINSFENTLKELNNDIKKHNIFDYTILLDKNSSWYIISKNEIWISNKLAASFDSINNNWNISINPASWDIWELRVYKANKKINQITKNWSDIINITLKDDTSIVSTLSWSKLNTVSFKYLNSLNIDDNIKILDILDSTGSVSYDWLTIENINWKIRYINNSNELTTPLIILFEKNWIENKLELN
jgi:prepilin-type N-terminal cleavage/methylation domain-containing protein